MIGRSADVILGLAGSHSGHVARPYIVAPQPARSNSANLSFSVIRSFSGTEPIIPRLARILRTVRSEIVISVFKALETRENRGFQQRRHRYLWGIISHPALMHLASSACHADLGAVEFREG